MQNAQRMQTGAELFGLHRRTIIGHQRSGQPSFLQRLAEPVHQCLGRLVQIPLQMTDQPGVIVNNAQQHRCDPAPIRGQYTARAMMEVGMPQAMCVFGLITAHLELRQAALRLAGTGRVSPGKSFTVVSPCLEITPDGAIGWYLAQVRILLCQGQQVVVVELRRPAGMLLVLRRSAWMSAADKRRARPASLRRRRAAPRPDPRAPFAR